MCKLTKVKYKCKVCDYHLMTAVQTRERCANAGTSQCVMDVEDKDNKDKYCVSCKGSTKQRLQKEAEEKKKKEEEEANKK